MFQVVVSLAIGILIGWNFHMFYIALEPPKMLQYESVTSQNLTTMEINSSKAIITPKKSIKKIESKKREEPEELSFQTLLDQNNFSDAMTLYMDGEEQQLLEYQFALKAYFYDRINQFPKATIEEILYYMEIEPQAKDIPIYLAKYYSEKGEFRKAIKLLFRLQDIHQGESSNPIQNDLNSIIETYLEQLKQAKELTKLISFLEELISKNFNSEKYSIRLSELYYSLDNYEKSEQALDNIESDSTYSAKAETILQNINLKEKELEQYTHKIPLQKIDSHYSINLSINQVSVNLLLDTGATYTFIDSEKIPSLIAEKEILLNTAGGEIIANLCQAETLIIQDIELKNFTVTTAPFKDSEADGLLGMNFFEQFNFKIDQKRGFLYLAQKDLEPSN
jgi:clan AA aspartic protease (TIGR02281 family)